MHKRIAFCLVVLIGLTVNAQTINLSGKVSNQAGKAVSSAIVALLGQGLKDTTGADGAYSLTRTTGVVLPLLAPQNEDILLDRGVLVFSLPHASPVKVEIFDIKGNLLKKELLRNASTGFYRFSIAENFRAAKLLVVRASIGRDAMTFRCLPLHNDNYMVNQTEKSGAPVGGKLAKIAAVNDTLKITATGFQTKTVAIISYENQQQNITLDSNTNNGKNPPGPSVGCGKDLGSLKNGTYTITSSSLSRQYIIDIPANYNKSNPYRLIFGMHCYGSSMQGVASGNYYGMKTLSATDNIPCIFVAPNGNGSGTPLWDGGQKDHTFFDDMLKLFKEQLCVDTTRVFSCGFSYGAMFTYSLSTNHQKQLRAVATFAPANWNIWLPTNTHEPIPYYQTTGTDDPNCKWIYDDANQQGGKYCLLGHIQDNGCTVPSTIPLATGNKHVSTEFSGCKDGYPVKFGSFQGQHTDNNTDAGSSGNWIYKEAWEFFNRF
jgi:poly(3-hydroxybutyrate) depolymerase